MIFKQIKGCLSPNILGPIILLTQKEHDERLCLPMSSFLLPCITSKDSKEFVDKGVHLFNFADKLHLSHVAPIGIKKIIWFSCPSPIVELGIFGDNCCFQLSFISPRKSVFLIADCSSLYLQTSETFNFFFLCSLPYLRQEWMKNGISFNDKSLKIHGRLCTQCTFY